MNERAAKGGGVVSDVSQQASLMSRIGATISGWFGPGNPMPPMAPPEVKQEGRALDYNTGYNQNLAPRAQEPVSFTTLRILADAYDLMRIIIETRKDQVSRMKWAIKPRKEGVQADSRCDKIAEFLRQPDKEHDWDTWMRALLEDMLVIDAATIYPRKTLGGDAFSLDLIDGATIKRIIAADGRTPTDGPAYQQVLKGVAAANFTREELFYRIRNWRVHRIYGFSPVEQVIATVNIALRRQMHQLQYYTEGNVPEALIGVPENWTVEQIRQFQQYWDDLLEGNTAKRRHAKFVPGAVAKSYVATKESVLKDTFDEWLARVVCFAFSISPNGFIAQVNRATAEVAQEASKEEGLAPILAWLKNTMDAIVAQVFNAPDLEFDWVEEANLDAKTKADIHNIYLTAKVLTPDEVREELGRPALTPQQKTELTPPVPPPGPGEQVSGQQSNEQSGQLKPKPKEGNPKDDKAAKADSQLDMFDGDGTYMGSAITKKSKSLAPINRDRKAAKNAESDIRSICEAAFDDLANEAVKACSDIGKASNDGKKVADALKMKAFDEMAKALADIYEDFVKDAVAQAYLQIGVDDPDLLALTNEKAVAWAREHAAELVGKKWVDGELVDNPDAAYRIDTKTRDGVNSLVTQAIDEGWSNAKLSTALRESYVFSAERADLIATTETAFADVAGNMLAYKDSGMVDKKKWIVAGADICDACLENKAQGAIPFDAEFASGHLAPPGHPKCRCDVLPVLKKKV